jgi:translation initiation factor IF-1
MQRFELVEVSGRIVERLGAALFKVRLPNGHEVVSHLSEESKESQKWPQKWAAESGNKGAVDQNHGLIGSEVLVRLRAFDLSSGAIIRFTPLDPEVAGR